MCVCVCRQISPWARMAQGRCDGMGRLSSWNPHTQVLSGLIETEVYITLLLRWFHSKPSRLLNDLSLPSDLKKRKAGEINLSLPPVGCRGKVSGPATCSGRKRGPGGLKFIFPLTLPHSFFQTAFLMPMFGVDVVEDTKVKKKHIPHLGSMCSWNWRDYWKPSPWSMLGTQRPPWRRWHLNPPKCSKGPMSR